MKVQRQPPSSASFSAFFSADGSGAAESSESTFDFFALYQQLPLGVIVFDMDGQVVIANDAFLQQWDMTLEQFPAEYSILRDPQLEKAGIAPLIRRVFAGDSVVLPPIRYDTSAFADAVREPKWFQGMMAPILDENEQVIQVVQIQKDISAQIRGELERESGHQRDRRLLDEMAENTLDFHAMYEQLPFSACVFDLRGRPLMANLAYTREWGITIDQLPVNYSVLADPQLEAAGVMPIVRRAFAGEIVRLPPMRYDIGRLIRDSVEKRWFEGVMYPARDSSGQVRQIIVLHTDVTGQEEAKIAAAARDGEEERRVREVLESTADYVVLVNRNWIMTYVNQHVRELIQFHHELVGMNIWEAFPDAAKANFWPNYHTTMEQRTPTDFEAYYPAPVDKWFHIRVFPTVEGISIFFQDITERRQTEKSLRDNEKLVVVGRLAASIAHEINNPLESVANLLYLLQGEVGMPRNAMQYVELAQQELQRVALITINTLKFFRQPTTPSQASILEVIGSVLTLFQGRLRQTGIRIQTRYRAHARLNCYAAELRQVFANFLGNALDAIPADGIIYLRVRPTADASRGEPGIVVTIADTGCGMSPHTIAHLYEAFFTTKELMGTGLGLWVSSELIQKHHGHVRVRSRQAGTRSGGELAAAGSGTVFRISFPYRNELVSDE